MQAIFRTSPALARRRALAAGALALLTVASAAVQAWGVTPASAATVPVGSVEVVTVASGFSTGASKTTQASCPAARPRVLGGGFTTTGQHIVVSEQRPVQGATGDAFVVTAVQDEVGTTASWQLLTYAYCSSAAPGWQLVTATSTTTSDPFNAIYPTCPNGKTTVGAGGRINGGAGQVSLQTQGIGSVSPNRIGAAGLEDLNGFSGNWSVTGYAICVTYAGALDVQIVQNQVGGTASPKTVSASCPSGKRLTGSAAWSDLPGTLISLRPNSSTPISVGAIARVDTGSSTSTWTLYVTAFCAL